MKLAKNDEKCSFVLDRVVTRDTVLVHRYYIQYFHIEMFSFMVQNK